MSTEISTFQDLLTYYHVDYTDKELAEITGLSQPTINNIRNGKQTGKNKANFFAPLIEQYEQETGKTVNVNIEISSPTSTEEKPVSPKSYQHVETTKMIEDTGFSLNTLLLWALGIAGLGYIAISSFSHSKKTIPDTTHQNSTNHQTNNQQQTEGNTQHE